MLGFHAETIKRYKKRGMIRAIVISSRCVRYLKNDVDAFIRKAMVGGVK